MHPRSTATPLQAGLEAHLGEKKILFVASTGGHLAQLNRFSEMYCPSPNSVWVTFDTPQSRSLLAGKRTFFVPYIKPRDAVAVTRSFFQILKLLRTESFDQIISTGAGLAVGAFAAARLQNVPCRYIESVSRVEGPSLTGRIVAKLGLADLNTQHEGWASKSWKSHPSVLSQFQAVERQGNSKDEALKIFVTLGTIRPYPFDAAVDALCRSNMPNEETIWQLGCTTRDGLPGQVFQELSAEEFTSAAMAADVVVTHAGVGTILQLLEMGIHPVVLPRLRVHGEHVDDHQLQIAKLVSDLDIATAVDPRDMTAEHLIRAASRRTVAYESSTA